MQQQGQQQTRTYRGGLLRVPALQEGYELLDRAERDAALAYFRAAVERDRCAESLEGLGMAAWLSHDQEALFEAREAAYEEYRRRGDALGAARLAIWLATDSLEYRGQASVSQGWLARAHRLLDGVDLAREHGWLALIEANFELMLNNDSEASLVKAGRASEVARATGDIELEMYSLALQGLTLVTGGRVRDGMAMLEEAAAACLAGEVRTPWVVHVVLCNMMDACDRTRDWDRAQEWFRHVGEFAARWRAPEFYAFCRPHYAVVLTWRGDWQEAESQLQLSIQEMNAILPPMTVEALVRLAELRWRQGRLDEAAELFEQVKHEPLAQTGRASLLLDGGDAAGALELLERCLRRLRASDRLERLPCLDLKVRCCLALASMDEARAAADELGRLALEIGTRPARAAACQAAGLLAFAEGDFEASKQLLEDAADLFEQSAAPFDAGRARTELARALLRLGRAPEAARCLQECLSAFESLGAGLEASRARRLLDEVTAAAPDGHPAGASGLSKRETEVLRLLAAGLSNQEIADRLILSVRTVQRHIENIYAKTGAHGRAAAAVFALSHNLLPTP